MGSERDWSNAPAHDTCLLWQRRGVSCDLSLHPALPYLNRGGAAALFHSFACLRTGKSPTETGTPMSVILVTGGTDSATFIYFPLQPCGVKLSFIPSVKQNNRGKKAPRTVGCTAHIQQHQAGHKSRSRTLQMSLLFCGSEGTSGHPHAYTPGGSCIMFSLHDLNYAFSMASCVKIPHVRDTRRRVKKTGFEPLCWALWVDSNRSTSLRTSRHKRQCCWGLVSCQLCYRVIRKVPVFVPQHHGSLTLHYN